MTDALRAGVPLLHDYLLDAARRLPEKVALVGKQARLTYAEIDARSTALANVLCRRGVARGDRVMIFGENSVETAIAFWAVLKANAVVCLVNPSTKSEKLTYLLNDCRATALLTEAHLAPAFAVAVAHSPHLRLVIVSGATKPEILTGLPGGIAWTDALAEESSTALPVRTCLDVDLAAIIYTSGSTGEPKGVMMTHRNMLAAATSVSAYLAMREDDVVLLVLPMAFGYGIYQMILCFKVGARVVLERSFAFPTATLQLMVREGVTGFPGVPTMFATLVDMESLPSHDLSRLRFLTNAAANLPAKHALRLRELFPQASIFSMYGLTECKRCTYLPPADLERKPTSVGIAIPNSELWVVDEHDNKLPPGQVGQLVFRGATIMRGYWEKPEATAERLRPGPIAGEQVLYTGDLCRLDEEGYLYIVGRMDDIIKTRGEKVAPSEVEKTLLGIKGVKEAAVIGVADELLGQALKAFVVLDPGVEMGEKEIQRHCQSRQEAFMVPKFVRFVPALPRSPNGKVRKADLEALTDARLDE